MRIEKRGQRLRMAVANSGRGHRQPFPRDLKRRLVEYARERHEQRASYVTIGQELGIAWPTIAEWLHPRVPVTSAENFRRVAVREAEAPSPSPEIVVVHPSGARVEGLDVASVAELLRRLSS